MATLVFWAGHFVVGLAYYLRFYLLKTKDEWKKETDEASKKLSSREMEIGEALLENKLFVLALYLLVGYINLLMHVRRIYRKIKEKGNE